VATPLHHHGRSGDHVGDGEGGWANRDAGWRDKQGTSSCSRSTPHRTTNIGDPSLGNAAGASICGQTTPAIWQCHLGLRDVCGL